MSDAPVIRIVKKKHAHAAHHGGSWKVAYADFVTAMMAFFLVMWIIGLSPPMRKAIASYFKDPVGVMSTLRGGAATVSVTNEANVGRPSLMSTSQSLMEQGADESKRFKIAKQRLEKKIGGIPDLEDIGEHVEIT